MKLTREEREKIRNDSRKFIENLDYSSFRHSSEFRNGIEDFWLSKIDTILEERREQIREELFEKLNCYEVDARTINNGMTFIDSREASRIIDSIPSLNLPSLK
jgi:hypothetical protein